jgi:glycolate oxidase FAD binding subunit
MRALSDPAIPSYGVRDRADLLEAVRTAAANKTRLDIRGHGTRTGWGRPAEADQIITLDGLSGIETYEPDELVMIAKAATPLKDILKALDDAGQMLAFDPPLGARSHDKAQGTLGGIIATNASGPRRLIAGAARDHLLGFNAVSGRGEVFKSGSRVMKNVTGYDLSKLMAGSFGTLAVMDEITVKTMPKPEDAAALLIRAGGEVAAGDIVRRAFDSAHEPTTGAIIPASAAAYSSCRNLKIIPGPGAIAAIGLEGFRVSVKSRVKALKEILGQYGDVSVISKKGADTLHADLREGALLQRQADRAIWKMSCPPAEGGRILGELMKLPCRAYADWGGGLIWLSLSLGLKGAAGKLRKMVASCGGHVTLVSASEEMRAAVDVFEPQPEALFELSRRIKTSFDPLGILNPGRMYKGI